jgi:hypothetical protein
MILNNSHPGNFRLYYYFNYFRIPVDVYIYYLVDLLAFWISVLAGLPIWKIIPDRFLIESTSFPGPLTVCRIPFS